MYLLSIYCVTLLLQYCIIKHYQLLYQEPTSRPGYLFLQLLISFFSSVDLPGGKKKKTIFYYFKHWTIINA